MSNAAAWPCAIHPERDELERRASEVRRGGQDAAGARWATLILAEHLIAAAAELDAATGLPLSTPLAGTLLRIREAVGSGRWPLPRDGFARCVELAVEPLERIVALPRWRPQRVRVRLQPEKVREQDVKCLTWLARQPGVTPHEKSASARQVLGVVRERNHDTPENRLVLRVLVALARLVRQRLDACRQGEFDSQATALCQGLQRMRQLVLQELGSSPMAGVAPTLRPEPNNVLLGDPDYSRAWRAFRWLGSRDTLTAQAWARADPRLTAALGATVLATLAGRRDAILENGLARIELEGRAGADFGLIISKTPLVAASSVERVGLFVFQALDPSGWCVEQRLLSGAPVLTQVEARTFLLSATLDETGALLPGRGAPARVHLQTDGGEESLGFLADAEGFRDVAQALVDRWLGPEPEAAAFLLLPEEGPAEGTRGRCVGWDLSTPRLRVASSLEDSARRDLPLLGRATPEGRWFVGREGLSLLGSTPSLGVSEVLARFTGAGTAPDLFEEGRKMMSALFRMALEAGAGPTAGGSLALAVPDGTDELGASLLREALPARQSNALFVPSSVAAALEWRRRQGTPVTPGPRPVLVLSTLAPGLTVSYLELLRDEEHAAAGDPFVWRRSLPLAPVAEASAASVSAWSLAVARAAVERASAHALEEPLLQKAATRLASGGLLAEFVDNAAARPVLIPLQEDGSRWLRVERHHVEPAAAGAGWLAAFRSWLTAMEVSGGAARLRAQVNGRPLVILLAGEPFGQPFLEEGIRSEMERCFGPSQLEVLDGGAEALARGAQEALLRRGRGEPTWSDTLPPLRLEIRTERGPQWLELLDGARPVRPGERVQRSIAQVLVLPRNERRIAFPLSRERSADKATAGFIATLEHECFPLTQDVKVRLEVDFHYAEDSFRVHVLPIEPAPFTALEFRWEPGAPDARGEIHNEPPAAPEGLRWDAPSSDPNLLIQGARDLRKWSSEVFRGNVIVDVKNPEKKKAFVASVRSLVREGSAEALGIKDLWPSARIPGPPAHVRSALDELLPLLLEFAGLPDETSRGARKSPPLTKPSLWSNPLVQGELDKLRLSALSALSALRGDAPTSLLPSLLERARQEPGSQLLLEAIGRQLTSGDRRAVSEALHWLVEQLAPREGARPQALKLPLWALSTGFWSTPSAVQELSAQGVSRLAEDCEKLLSRIATEWHAERVGPDLCAEALAVLLGLLRLRPGVKEPRLVAGTVEATRLAVIAERAAAALEHAGKPMRPRLKLGEGETLTEVVCSALRGQRLALVRALED
ncbi:DUF2357 domain-containing protein [Corallococcus sp. CA041A]|uniref:DUF2357 domain-containing protein n=1 Tax=Corallococcus sp. CA041A TaxID=2316727 RepID=UPI0013158543|nr:DUF2357 domain-containing protein [Corallococcus sp. CA041A]